MTPRSIRRAAERKRKKLERKANALATVAPQPDEDAGMFDPNIPEEHFAADQTRQRVHQRAFAARESASPATQPVAESPLDANALYNNDLYDEDLCFSPPAEAAPGQAEPTHSPSLSAASETHQSISAAQLAANRANAQLSTGPTSETGKAKSSLNAVKTGLTGRTVLLHTDDVAEYQRYLTAYEKELRPVGQRESDLVQSIVDTMWRLRRIPGLETAIFARGYLECENAFDQHAPSLRPGMIELQTFMKYEKQLRNLQLQEARLSRRREKEMAELRQLQQERKAQQERHRMAALDAAAREYLIAQKNNAAFTQPANGFEFSTAEIERYLERSSPGRISRATGMTPRDTTSHSAKTRVEAA